MDWDYVCACCVTWHNVRANLTHREGAPLPVQGLQPVVELITERVAARYASGAAVFSVNRLAATTQNSIPQLALFLKSSVQPQSGGDGDPMAFRAARRFGPGHYTARMVRNGDGWLTPGVAGGMSLYQLRLAKPQPQQELLFSPVHLLGPTVRAADTFDVDVDIELLPVNTGFLYPVDAGEWLALPLGNAVARAHAALRGAARRVASFHAAARAWTCAHRQLLLGLFAMQLALTTLIFLLVHGLRPAAGQQKAADNGVVSAAAEAQSQLSQPLLPGERDVDAGNPLHGMVVMIKTS